MGTTVWSSRCRQGVPGVREQDFRVVRGEEDIVGGAVIGVERTDDARDLDP